MFDLWQSSTIIDLLFMVFPVLVLLVAIVKRSEMAIFLALTVSCYLILLLDAGSADNLSSMESILIFCSGANLSLMLVAYSSWRINRNTLPLLIGILAGIDTVNNFSHLLIILNTGISSSWSGILAGVISYVQLFLICIMNDSKGALNELFANTRHVFRSFLRMAGNNKNSGRS